MKKVYLFGIILAATTAHFAPAFADVPGVAVGVPAPQAGCPKAFQGFHLGGNVGYGVGWAKHKFAARNDLGEEIGSRNDLGVRGFDGGVGVGYTHRLCNWAIGIAFDANWASTKGKARVGFATLDEDDDEVEGINDGIRGKARLRNSLQLYARLGYVMREIAMPFIGLGWDNSQWEQRVNRDNNDDDDNNGRKKKRFNAFLWKAGVDFLATKHVVVGFEYTGTIANKKTLRRGNDDDDDIVAGAASSFRPQYNKFALTAKIVY